MIDTESSRECHVFFSSTTNRDDQSLLLEALKRELKIDAHTSKKQAA